MTGVPWGESVVESVRWWWWRRNPRHRWPENRSRSREAIARAAAGGALLPEQDVTCPDPGAITRPVAPPYEPMPGQARFVHRTDDRWFGGRNDAGRKRLG